MIDDEAICKKLDEIRAAISRLADTISEDKGLIEILIDIKDALEELKPCP